ncbi:two-component sensor histidine kinase, partial [Nocardia tengchongensis]
MSSSPPAERRGRAWSLRTRLLLGQIVLLVVVVVGTGAATELALQQFLVHQLDTGLIDIEHRALVDSGGGPSLGPRPQGTGSTGAPQLPPPE